MLFLCSPSMMSLMAVITWLLFWPVMSSVWGPSIIGKQSLILLVFFVVSDFLKKKVPFPSFLHGLLDAALLVGLMLQSGSLVPNFVVNLWSYSIVFLGEGLFMWMESVLLLSLVLASGRLVTRFVFDYTSESSIVQIAIIVITFGLYYQSIWMIICALRSAPSPIFTHLSLTLILIHVVNAVWSYFTPEGVITNSALMFLASTVAFYLSVMSAYNSETVNPPTYAQQSNSSFIEQVFELPDATSSIAINSMSWVRKNYGLDFWIVIFIRLSAAKLWVHHSRRDFNSSGLEDTLYVDEDDDLGIFARLRKLCSIQTDIDNPWIHGREDVTSQSVFDQKLILKILCVVIYSQQIMQRTGYFSFDSKSFVSIELFACLRMLQSFFIGLFYSENLYQNTANRY